METGNNHPQPLPPLAPTFHLTGSAFQPDQPEQYRLTLELDGYFLKYTALHVASRRFEKVGRIELNQAAPAPWADAWKQLSLPGEAFASTHLILHNKAYTLVPQGLFDAGGINDYLNYHYGEDPQAMSQFMPLPVMNAVGVFRADRNLHAWALQHLPGGHIVHPMSILIESLLSLYKHEPKAQMFIHVRTGFIDVVVISNRALLLANSFECHSPEDHLYYVLFVMEQLALTPSETETALMGDILEGDALHLLMAQYLHHIRFEGRPLTIDYADPYRDIPAHQFFILHQEYLCAS